MDQFAQPKRTWSRNPRHPLALLHVRKGSRRSLPERRSRAVSIRWKNKKNGKLGIIRNTGDEKFGRLGEKNHDNHVRYLPNLNHLNSEYIYNYIIIYMWISSISKTYPTNLAHVTGTPGKNASRPPRPTASVPTRWCHAVGPRNGWRKSWRMGMAGGGWGWPKFRIFFPFWNS